MFRCEPNKKINIKKYFGNRKLFDVVIKPDPMNQF